ncbi:Uncharacterised protein [Klebsiella pneumoniae]|nr:Uncharacterised protein [Klebsiella pneumoniae]
MQKKLALTLKGLNPKKLTTLTSLKLLIMAFGLC